MTFGERLKQVRRENGLRQCDLADRVHLVRGTVAQYERLETPPKIDTVEKLAAALKVPPSTLDPRLSDERSLSLEAVFDADPRTREENNLLRYYRKLNDSGRDCLFGIIRVVARRAEYKK